MPTKKSTDVEKVFQLIQEGKAKETGGDRWAAVDCYAQARTLLTKLSDIAKAEVSLGNEEEQMKISELYQRQSREYLHRARKCLIGALQTENEQDEKYREASSSSSETSLDNYPPKFESISQEEAEKRVQNFVILFSKETERVSTQQDDVDVEQQQSSLEERLMELNKSIPQGFKTSAERIMSINQGLRRLGLTLYTDESRSEHSLQLPKPEHEQVADIIAQAKDEVKFNVGSEEKPKAHKRDDQADDDSATGDNDDDDEEEDLESDEEDILLHRKAIRKQVVEAQVELANLVALLDKEPVRLDKAKAENEVDLVRGKKALADARRYLGRALKLWNEDS